MTKRIVCLAMVVMMLAGAVAFADGTEGLTACEYRSLFFATDDGSPVENLELPKGTVVNLDEYVTVKTGYIFEGWFAGPQDSGQIVTELTLNEHTIVWAKWKLKDGLTEKQIENGILAREVIGNNVVIQTESATLIAPVTDLWVQQNARLEALMQIYNQKFKQ